MKCNDFVSLKKLDTKLSVGKN